VKGIPSVSVVVPTYNVENTILECVRSLLSLNCPEGRLELIFIDDCSTDSTAEALKEHPDIELILLTENKGPANARNVGIKRATGEIVAFTDADCVVDKDWLMHLTRKFQEEGVGGVGGNILPYNPETVVEKYLENLLSQEKFINLDMPFVVTANAAYTKKILEEVGFFDERFFYGEDADLSWRVLKAGYRISYEPKAVVYHRHRSTFKGLFKQAFGYGMGYVKLYHKHRTLAGKYKVDLLGYLIAPYEFFIKFPWRIVSSVLHKEERKFYVLYPVCRSIETVGLKIGLIYGSVKYREIVI
jgi:cellulose synthase/poly-beta-1,6-N-acetylglucosamine synthase-like glycosyltransferase